MEALVKWAIKELKYYLEGGHFTCVANNTLVSFTFCFFVTASASLRWTALCSNKTSQIWGTFGNLGQLLCVQRSSGVT